MDELRAILSGSSVPCDNIVIDSVVKKGQLITHPQCVEWNHKSFLGRLPKVDLIV